MSAEADPVDLGTGLLSDPEELHRQIERLVAKKHAHAISAVELEALAEAYFRFGVHPGTPPDEGLRSLRYAVACDQGNPKFSYHLARRCLVLGDLDRAAKWFSRALAICPTSHRLWVHASLLQRELDARHRGDERFEPDVLRQRSIAVMEHVRDGADHIDSELLDFAPPPRRSATDESDATAPTDEPVVGDAGAPRATRLRGGGRCRWSGVEDLLAEELLHEPPSEPTRDRLRPLLIACEQRRRTKRGGDAAFAALAVAWLVRGYPTSFIRRLLGPPGAGAPPSLVLVETVCTLYETGDAELPGQLRDALRNGRIPPFVAALVHQQRLLWHPLAFPRLSRSCRAARELLAGPAPDDTAAAKLADELLRATVELEPERSAPVADAEGDADAPEHPMERLEQLAEQVQGLSGDLEERMPRLRALTKEPDHLDQAGRGDADAVRKLVAEIDERCGAGLAVLAAIKEEGASQATGADEARLDELEQRFQRATGRLGPALRLLSKLRLPPVNGAASKPGPSVQAGEGPPAGGQPPGVASLRHTLERIDQQVAAAFTRAGKTLEVYPPSLRSAPLRALRAQLRAREAETWYRFGDQGRACALWSQVAREDRLQPAPIKNIAVALTIGGERSHATQTWQAYCELLYARAVMAGDVRVDAADRIAFHRHFGGSYGPAALAVCSPTDEQPEADVSVAAFLASRERVGLFVRHKLLETLNAKLDFASPSLLLGVARSDDQEVRRQARDRLLALVAIAVKSLPSRVRAGFEAICKEQVEAAYRDSWSARQRTRALDPWYQDEVERQLEWIRAVSELKRRLERTAQWRLQRLPRRQARKIVDELILLDRIPVASSEELLRTMRRDARKRGDPASLQEVFATLRSKFES